SKAAPCSDGGQALLNCMGPTGPVTVSMTFTACTLEMDNGTVTFDGTIMLRGIGQCPNLVFPPLDEAINLSANFRDAEGMQRLLITADVTGNVSRSDVAPG